MYYGHQISKKLSLKLTPVLSQLKAAGRVSSSNLFVSYDTSEGDNDESSCVFR